MLRLEWLDQSTPIKVPWGSPLCPAPSAHTAKSYRYNTSPRGPDSRAPTTSWRRDEGHGKKKKTPLISVWSPTLVDDLRAKSMPLASPIPLKLGLRLGSRLGHDVEAAMYVAAEKNLHDTVPDLSGEVDTYLPWRGAQVDAIGCWLPANQSLASAVTQNEDCMATRRCRS